jgi:hypothetical protein
MVQFAKPRRRLETGELWRSSVARLIWYPLNSPFRCRNKSCFALDEHSVVHKSRTTKQRRQIAHAMPCTVESRC